jgi:restriction system protein
MACRRRRSRRSQTSALSSTLAAGYILVLVVAGILGFLSQNAPYLLILIPVIAVGVAAAYITKTRRQREQWLSRVQTLNDVLLLSPTQFEYAVGELLRAWGYRQVRHTGGGGDLAADLTCYTPDGTHSVVVQCKRYTPGKPVGSPEIQKFIGMLTVHHRAEQGIFVTTSSFTQPALTLAREHSLRTIDGQELAQHIQQVQAQQQQGQQQLA